MAEQRTIGEDTAPDRLRGVRVLVVDDDHDARAILRSFLAYLGAEVTLASGGEEALRLLPTARPHVVVTDIAMPRGDGYHVLHALRGSAPSRHALPVIAMTAFGAAHSESRARGAGFDAWVRKPIKLGAFADAVERLARGRRAA